MHDKRLVKKAMYELIEKINYHDELYYKKNYQEISDEEYDKLREQLLKLEKQFPDQIYSNSPNKKVLIFNLYHLRLA